VEDGIKWLRRQYASAEVVPDFVELEVAVPA
jgi:hypothetical protein